MRVRFLLPVVLMLVMPAVSRAGTYCGAVGTTDSTAIYKDSSSFVEWASGYEDYNVGSDCTASWQTPAKALGKAVGDSYDICCLGNGGRITMTFDKPIANGTGWDFAVFENSFNDTFLELGYVEVSSNGTDFFRFPNYSLTASAVSAFGSVDPTNIDGLAGKYRQGYGTPFNLDQLVGVSSLLDVNNVRFVRIQDIVGDGTYFDTAGHVIYDPHKTTGSGGFDLDAVGVINSVPEPGTLILLAVGLICTIAVHRKPFGTLCRGVRDRFTPSLIMLFRYLQAFHPERSPNYMSPITSFARQHSSAWHMSAAFLLTLGILAEASYGTVINFEDLGQGPNACVIDNVTRGYYWNGSDGSGEFTSGGASFNNSYNGAWSGFSYSNVNYTNTTTSDYTHQFAAVTGTGVGGSGNYALGYGCSSCIDLFGGVLPEVTIPDGMKVVSAMFTNTTYAAASMLHGDGFAKQFTSSDWFKLTIIGEDASGASIGSVDLYLAQNGSIVTTWGSVDLSSLAAAKTLEFDLTSSDTGTWGMNTPAYFAMDNLTLSAVPEPSMLALLCGAGLVGAIWTSKRRFSLRTATLGRKECC